MHQHLSKREIAAINAVDTSVSERTSDDRFVFDAGPQWFSEAAQQLLAPKPGLVLHLQTDCGERSAHRYASGEVAVPSYIVRQLLRSKHGDVWLKALMDGSDEQWWRDLQRDQLQAARARTFIEGFDR